MAYTMLWEEAQMTLVNAIVTQNAKTAVSSMSSIEDKFGVVVFVKSHPPVLKVLITRKRQFIACH